MIQIPLPSGGMIHLGNFFCILAALLCGGLIGGIAGGVGCGLYDLIIYSSVRGFFYLFGTKIYYGLFVGFLFRFIINKDKKN
ncbi:MAG: ECF transporter S component [Clostridium sp.]|nr:MAG: ECF transporter S component [Clostridium sp.]